MQKIHLYSKREERLNTISHGSAALLALIGVILMILKVSGRESLIIFALTAYSVSTLCVYSFSFIYHGAKDLKRKIFWQKLDHSIISIMIIGFALPGLLIVASGTVAFTMLILVAVSSIVNVALNLIDVAKFKKYSLMLYGLGLVFIAVGMSLDMVLFNKNFLAFIISGLIVVLLGGIFYLDKKREYNHFIWHIADIICSVLHFLAFYLYVAKA